MAQTGAPRPPAVPPCCKLLMCAAPALPLVPSGDLLSWARPSAELCRAPLDHRASLWATKSLLHSLLLQEEGSPLETFPSLQSEESLGNVPSTTCTRPLSS